MDIQIPGLIPLFGVVVVGFSSLLLLISSNWRWSIVALALQYFGAFLLILIEWRIPMAATVVLAGWISCFVLFTVISSVSRDKETDDDERKSYINLFDISSQYQPISAMLFRLIAAGVVGLAVISLVPGITDWIPGITLEQSLGGLILIGLGLLHLGWTANPFRVITGLLTVLTGFEIFYSAVEISALVAGLLAAVTLGLSLVGAYMIIAPTLESVR